MYIFWITHYTSNKQQSDGGETGIFCLFVGDNHALLGSCGTSAQYSPTNFFVNLFHSKNSILPHCFSDLIHTEYRKLHKNNGHSTFFLPPIMRSSVGQCRNIRFRQLYASHVIITSGFVKISNFNIPKTPFFFFLLKCAKASLIFSTKIWVYLVVKS